MAERDLRVILDSFPAYIWFKDTNNRILRTNQWAAQELGLTADALVGRATSDIYPEFAEKYAADDREVITTGLPKRGIVEMVTDRTGARRWVQTDKVPYRDQEGEIVGVAVFSVDITERMLAEQELRSHAEALEHSNEALESFARLASHDMQEPLRMIGSYLQLLERQCGSTLSDSSREYLNFALDGAQRLRGLIDDILAFSKAGEAGPPARPTDTGAALEAALVNLRSVIEQSRAKIDVQPMPRVRAHPSQVVQLFQNLIHNAIKYAGSRRPLIEVRAERDGDRWRLTVCDHGIGIAKEEAERVFRLGERLPGTGVTGAGFGLAICRRIVRQHGGNIWTVPTPGGGATFHLTLPAAD